MRKYEAPVMEMNKFSLQNIITSSGDTPVKENAVTAATAYLTDDVKVDSVLKITL